MAAAISANLPKTAPSCPTFPGWRGDADRLNSISARHGYDRRPFNGSNFVPKYNSVLTWEHAYIERGIRASSPAAAVRLALDRTVP
jgi:hypothetical protein